MLGGGNGNNNEPNKLLEISQIDRHINEADITNEFLPHRSVMSFRRLFQKREKKLNKNTN